MINPIVEFLYLDATWSEQRNKFELFPADEEHRYNGGLKECLENARGIYIFYDSRGRGLYVGKTTRQDLWSEAENAFNRNLGQSDTRKIYSVDHPYVNNVEFRRADEMHRRIRLMPTRLYDLAHYFSAYEVRRQHISTIEALLIRAFPNDLLNARMERFKQ